MTEKLRNFRIRVDGLYQLLRSLSPNNKWIVDLAMIETLGERFPGITLEEWLHIFNERGYAIMDSSKLENSELKDFIKPIPQEYKELNKAGDSFYLAKSWLGIVLKELGIQNLTKDKAVVSGIQPKFDTLTHIGKVENLKSEISQVIVDLVEIQSNRISTTSEFGLEYKTVLERLAWENSLKYLYEVKFFLNLELNRIREDNKKASKYEAD